MDRPSLLIVGAGIGGLALALAARQRGMNATVWERAAMLREIGAGLLLTSNAVWVLQELGVLEEACRRGRVVQQWEILDRRGRVLQTFANPANEVGSISIARAAFQQVLLAALPSELVSLDHELTSISMDETTGRVTGCAGDRTKEVDLIVGADGARSIVRKLRFDPAPARALDYVGWRGMVDLVPSDWAHGRISESWGEGSRFGIAPVSSTRSYWYATENVPAGWTLPPEERKAHLLRRFRNWHSPIQELIAATRDEDILLSDLSEHSRLKSWVSGPVTLLGDAAHLMTPNLGQGAAMALEDAWVLARCLAEERDVPRALSHYESRRKSRAEWVVWQSRQVGRLIQLEQGWLTALRDAGLRMTPDFVGAGALAPVFSFRA